MKSRLIQLLVGVLPLLLVARAAPAQSQSAALDAPRLVWVATNDPPGGATWVGVPLGGHSGGDVAVIQASDTGMPGTWQTFVMRVARPDGTLDAVEAAAVNSSQRFYRTVQQ
jgi:hypothetical protein